MRKLLKIFVLICIIGVMVSCGSEKETEGIFYELSDSSYWVTGYGGESKTVIVPNTYEGVVVTGIDYKAFSDTDIEKVAIGKNVTWIDLYAFENCTKLKTVELPDKLDTIRGYAFKNCTSIKKIEIPESCWFIGYQAFSGWTSKQTIVIHSSSTRFEEGWDSGCDANIVFK